MWRRQLWAASGAALIVPLAMVAALVLLALGGGFSQLGVLGQIFAGPPAPSAGPLAPGVASGGGARAARNGKRTGNTVPVIPVIPVAQSVATRPGTGGAGAHGRVVPGVAAPRIGIRSTGGAIRPGGLATRPVTGSPGGVGSTPVAPTPTPVSSTPSPSPGASPAPVRGPTPSPGPSPRPNPIGTVIKAVTSVTQHLPGPVGPGATQVVQGVGRPAHGPPPSPGVPSRGLPARGFSPPGLPARGFSPPGLPARGAPPRGLPARGFPPAGPPFRGSPPAAQSPTTRWRDPPPASPVTPRMR